MENAQAVRGSTSEIATGPRSSARSDQRSLARGLSLFAVHYVLYGLTLIDAIGRLPIALNVLFAIGNGVLIALLFIVGHDCAHGSLVPGRQRNLWLGRFAFLPSLHSISLWRQVHNKFHHGRTNMKGVDPVWAPMSLAEYNGASTFRRWLERVYRGPSGPLIYYYIAIWIPMTLFPLAPEIRRDWKRYLPGTIFVLVGFAITIAIIAILGHFLAPERPIWLEILLGWAIPFAVFNYLAAFTVYLNHTHPQIAWFMDEKTWSSYRADVRGTVHVEMPINLFPVYTDVMAHTAHHADPTTPVYALAGEQAALERTFGADVKRYLLSVGEYRRIYKACKLFDFDRVCWTDFEGVPTAAPIKCTN